MNTNNNTITVRVANKTRFGNKISAAAMARMTSLADKMEITYNEDNHTPSFSLSRALLDLARESRMGLTEAHEALRYFQGGYEIKVPIKMRTLEEHGNYSRHEYMDAYNNNYKNEYNNIMNNNNNNNNNKKIKKEVLMEAVEEEITKYEKKEEEKTVLKKRKRVELYETQSLLKDAFDALNQRDMEVEGLKRQVECLANNAKRLTEKLNKIQTLLECPVCLEVLEEARFIGCGHIVCTRCMDDQFDAGKNFCPICKWKPPILVAGLMPQVYVLEDIIGIIEPTPPMETTEEGTQIIPDTQEDSIVITENATGEQLNLNESDVDSEEEY